MEYLKKKKNQVKPKSVIQTIINPFNIKNKKLDTIFFSFFYIRIKENKMQGVNLSKITLLKEKKN